MTLKDFKQHIEHNNQPPAELSLPLQALWFSKKGDWHKAHELCQQAASKDGDWVHAHLHHEEGDKANAGYWYSRAGKARPSGTLAEEWNAIAEALL